MKRNHSNMGMWGKCAILSAILLGTSISSVSAQTTPMTKAEAKKMYSTKALKHVTVHDPSVTYDQASKQYYIYGTHRGCAKTSDLQNWTSFSSPWGIIDANGNVKSGISNSDAFTTNQTKTVVIGGEEVAFGNFDATEWAGAVGDWDVNGNMWAPDIIWNPTMQKWCQYLSINGPSFNSVIILLTSDNIEGPYVYQGPVVYSGFLNASDERISFKKTDMELVLGKLETLPSRYNQKDNWGNQWLNAIDPSVFYDEEGKLWMAYGSWFGGIYMLELNEQNGLRDYDVKYASDYSSKGKNCTSDAYFGKKIAGGHWVSGEGSYIEHIGNYYYLFVTNGGLSANGGYEMRVYRSDKPNGPYTDVKGKNAIFTSWALNFGVNCDTRGNKLMGPYDKWGFMTLGERAQGHNSVIAAEDGRTYLVYHTRFNDGTEGHQVRVHQLFLNEKDWLVAAPFEYTGETVTDEDIKTKQAFSEEDIVGTYKMLLHKYSMDHNNGEEVLPVTIQLNSNGSITGDYTGRWNVTDGTSYMQVVIGGVTYNGVVVEQQMEPTTIKAVSFTASNTSGVNIWGYKMRDDYNLAYQLNNMTMPVRNNQTVTANLNLYDMEVNPGVQLEWTSSNPEILSHGGHYNPAGLTENTPVELVVKLSVGDYYWADTLTVNVAKDTNTDTSYLDGIVAYYDFNSLVNVNAYDTSEKATRRKYGSGKLPALEEDNVRMGNFFHQSFGSNGNCSLTQIPNPFFSEKLDDGVTFSFWVKRADENLWDDIWSFYNNTGKKRLYMTGNAYIGYNNNSGNWLDINHPSNVTTKYIPVGKWTYVTITISREKGITIFIDGGRKYNSGYKYAGSQNGADVAKLADFDYNEIVDFITQCPSFYFGYGSFWGSADICYDDLIMYNRVLSLTEVMTLNKMNNRVTDFTVGEGGTGTGIESIRTDRKSAEGIYDLTGRKVKTPVKGGIYIINGKKVVF